MRVLSKVVVGSVAMAVVAGLCTVPAQAAAPAAPAAAPITAARHANPARALAQGPTSYPFPAVSAPLSRPASQEPPGVPGSTQVFGSGVQVPVIPPSRLSPQPPTGQGYVVPPQLAASQRRGAVKAAGGVIPLSGASGASVFQAPGSRLVHPASADPGARNYQAAAYDSSHNLDVLFGGANTTSGELGDTWTFDGTSWTKHTGTAPSARHIAMMAYDAATNTTILFGGYDGAYKNDTWSFNATTMAWTKLTPATSPSARTTGTMAYDAALSEIVLVGGFASGAALHDTWVWNGLTWASVTTPVALTGRYGAELAYDATAADLVMYGGANTAGAVLSDTWTYGSTGWSTAALAPSHDPGARIYAGFAYDATIGRPVLYGGTDGASIFTDLWMWDGADWQVGRQFTSPGLRKSMAFVQSAGNGQLMVQGGYNTGLYSDTNLFDWDPLGAQKATTFETHPLDDRSSFAVNTAYGNVKVSATDFNARGVGINLDLTRVYNTYNNGNNPGSAGYGWTFPNGPDTYLWAYPDGSIMVFGVKDQPYELFFKKSGTTFTSPTGLNAVFATSGSGWTLTFNASSEKLTFNSSGLLTSDVDRNGNGTAVAYTAGKPSSVTDSHGVVYTISYGTNGYIHTISNTFGQTVTYTQDTNGHLTQVQDAAGEITNYTYTSGLAVEDPNAKTTTFTTSGTSMVVTYPETTPNTVTYAWTPPTVAGTWEEGTSTDPNGHATTYDITYFGGVLTVTDTLGHPRSNVYSPTLNQKQTTDSLGKIINFGFDSTTDLPSSVSIPTGASASAQYATSGTMCTTTDTTHPNQPKCTQDMQKNVTTYQYDTAGNTTSQTNAASITTNYSYNPAITICGGFKGQLCSSDDGAGTTHKTTYTYNSNGYLTTITPPSALGTTLFTYDTAGRVHTMTDGKSQVSTYTYDGDNRVTQILLLGNATCTYANNTCITYGYDSNGNVTDRHDKSGDTTLHYTVMNKQDTITPPSTTALSATYDPVGNMATYTDAQGTVSYDYNADNSVKDLYEPGGSCTGTISLCTTFGYNTNGYRTTTTYPGPTVMTATPDFSGRTTEIKAVHSGTTLTDFTYIYGGGTTLTDTGQVTSRTDAVASRTTTYTYDTANRLSNAVEKNGGTTTASWLYCYDNAGNRTSYSTTAAATCPGATTTYGYNTADQLTSTNGSSTGWDYNLNGLEGDGNSTLPRTTEQYTGSNALKTVTVGGTAYASTYAGVGNDQRLTFNTLTYTSGQLGLAYQTDGTTTVAFTHDPAGTLVSERTGGSSYYYIYDGQGSVIDVVNSAGVAQDTYSYDPYGVVRAHTGTLINPIGYTSAYTDAVTGLVHLGARFYDPALGRFTQPDPSGQETNPYVYAGDNPINAGDPTGQYSALQVGLAIALLGVVVAGVSAIVLAGFGAIFAAAAIDAISNYAIAGFLAGGGLTVIGSIITAFGF